MPDCVLNPRNPEEPSKDPAVTVPSKLKIRAFLPDDLSAVLKIQDACKGIASWRAIDYEHLAADPRGIFLVAELMEGNRAELPGFLASYRIDTEAELWNIAVAPENRRRGIGRALLQDACRMLSAAGARRLFLEVRESNLAALELYRFIGFTQLSRRRDYYQDPREDALIMVLNLASDQL